MNELKQKQTTRVVLFSALFLYVLSAGVLLHIKTLEYCSLTCSLINIIALIACAICYTFWTILFVKIESYILAMILILIPFILMMK